MTDEKQPIESPSGLELHPEPPPTARISKKVAVAVLGVVVVVGVLVVYGLYARREQQQVAQTQNEEKHPESARSIGDQLVKEIAPPAVANPAPAFPGRTGLDPVQGSAGTQAHDPGGLRPPGLVYHADEKGGRSVSRGASTDSNLSTGGVTEISAEEKLRLVAFRQEQEAMNAPTVVRGGNGLPSTPNASPINDALQQFGPLATLLGGGKTPGSTDTSATGAVSAGARMQAGSDYDLQNNQERKQAFIEKSRGRAVNNYLKSTRTPALRKYEVKMGWDIPAILEQGINSDLPGEVKALVRSNVYDTATGKYLLIPQGSRLVGIYDSQIAYGQNRLQVIWSRIIYPDGSSINLDGMMGQDIQGRAGFREKVDNHYKRLVGFALLTSVFTAA